LGLAVGVWIAGFDIIYGCQDVEFDKRNKLHSVPVRFGVQGALNIAKAMHMISIIGFFAVGHLMHLQWIYFCGVLLAAAVLVYQHSIVSSTNLKKVTQAYFMRNGLVSIALLIFTVISMIL
ncbi:MAG: UbiA family prenyltransferase, partial [Sporomusaceae bacterium]|nr:UbiA family prenyltransferase [Sporomusaceae bacterium]